MQEECGFGRSADGEAVIDPARMVARGIPPGCAVQIAGLRRDSDAGHPERLEDETAKGRTELLPRHLLEEPAHEEVADIRIRPAVTGRKDDVVGADPPEQLLAAPRLLPALHGLVILDEVTILGQARRVLEKLPQRVGPGTGERVEKEAALPHQHQRGRGERRLGQAPPRYGQSALIGIAELPVLDGGGEQTRGIHPC